MAKSTRQKLKLLYLARYLHENTDEDNPATTAQLIEYLRREDIGAERKSIYDDMEALRGFGLDVERARLGSATGWYVGARRFQLPELRLLVDSVQSSRFITQKKSLELIAKIESLTSRPQARTLQRQVWVKNRIKSMNESIYYLVDDLHAAIAGDRQIRFRYYAYAPTGERVLRHGGRWYVLSPCALMWDNENYYLVGYDAPSAAIKHFRVDKMTQLQLLDAPREGRELREGLNMAEYASSHFGMFSGEAERVRLEFDGALAGAVIDRFGADTILVPAPGERFTVTVSVALSDPFFGWLFSFGEGARILAPPAAAQEMRRRAQALARQYGE